MGKSFPKVKFGYCERCGRRGYYVDSDGVSTVQSGYELKEYEGQWLDQLCINELVDLREDDILNDRHVQEEQFRASAGVEKS